MFTGTRAHCIRTFLQPIWLAWLPACEPKCEYPVWSLKKQKTRLKPANKEKFRQRAQLRRKLKIFVTEMHLQMCTFFAISKRNWQCNKKIWRRESWCFCCLSFLSFLLLLRRSTFSKIWNLAGWMQLRETRYTFLHSQSPKQSCISLDDEASASDKWRGFNFRWREI